MPHIRLTHAVSIDELTQMLERDLGSSYRVSRKTGAKPALSVRRNSLAHATVRLESSNGGTDIRVSGDGLIVGKLVNSATIARKVAAALAHADAASEPPARATDG